MQLDSQIAQIPDPNSFVSGAGGEDVFAAWVEGHAVDGVGMRVFRLSCCLFVGGGAEVEDLEGEVVGDGGEHPGELRVEVDIVDDGGVVRECALSVDGFGVGFVVFDVPVRG